MMLDYLLFIPEQILYLLFISPGRYTINNQWINLRPQKINKRKIINLLISRLFPIDSSKKSTALVNSRRAAKHDKSSTLKYFQPG